MRPVAVRVGLVTVAVLAAAWLVLSIRSLDSLEAAEGVLDRAREGPIEPAEVAGARQSLQDARRFSTDGEALLAEASLLRATGRQSDARVLTRRLLRMEPENDQAWFLALFTARDAAEATAARRKLEELNPWAAEALR